MTQPLEALLHQCENDLRAGRVQNVARVLTSLNTSDVPRALLLPFANMARRAGRLSVGLRLLTPLIYPERNRWQSEATDAELAEYAFLLQGYGAVSEALEILNRVNPEKVPQALLYKAICHFNLWEYAAAVSPLEQYLKADVSDYSLLLGKVNLAAALLNDDSQSVRAERLLEENIELARQGSHSRLHGNCLEMRGQLHIRAGNLVAASRDLAAAAWQIDQHLTHDRLYVEKWIAIVEALRNRDPAPLTEFRAKALQAEHWESLREVDLYLLKLRFDQEIFDRLIFGTPHQTYRWRICKMLNRMPDKAEYIFGEGERIFDLATGSLDGWPVTNAGKKIHQMVEILTRDLYAPVKLGGLFAGLFPGEFFDINSSADRVHQIVRRTRRWLSQHRLPMEFVCKNGFYSLLPSAGLAIRLPLKRPEVNTFALEYEKLCRLIPGREFTPQEVRTKLQLSPTTFNSLINWSLEKRLVQRQGRGRATRYSKIA